MMYLTDHYPGPASMGTMSPYQYPHHAGPDYSATSGYKMDYSKAGPDFSRGPCAYEAMPHMMATHPGLEYDFARIDIYGRVKQGRAKGIYYFA